MPQALEKDTGTWERVPSRGGMAPTQVGSLFGPYTRARRLEGVPTGTTVLVPFTRGASAPTEESASPRGEKPTVKDKLHAELISYASLPRGWDGYDGVPAQLEAATDAIAFLDLKPADIPLPYPQIAPDGEVGLYWRTDEVYADVGFYGNGEFSYYARYAPRGGKPQEDGRDHCNLDADEWPEGLLLILNKLER